MAVTRRANHHIYQHQPRHRLSILLSLSYCGSFICIIYLFIYSFIDLYSQLVTPSCYDTVVDSFVYIFIYSFLHSSASSLIHQSVSQSFFSCNFVIIISWLTSDLIYIFQNHTFSCPSPFPPELHFTSLSLTVSGHAQENPSSLPDSPAHSGRLSFGFSF